MGEGAVENPLRAFVPLHILVVDDDPLVGEISVDHYRAMGFEVESASGGAEALRRMEAKLPDLVLCDRKMPEMSGAELLQAIRERGPEWQKVLFVFVTALNDRRDRYAMMPLKPDGYLGKPIDFEKEDQFLADLLSKNRQAI